MSLVTLTNVTVRFGLSDVLDGVSLDIQPGERLGLVGENGAGKSTLLAVIAGELKPDSGTVRAGVNIAFARQCGADGDAQTTDPPVSTPDPELEARLRIIELANSDQDADTMSGGEQTRVKLARAFGERAPLMLLDEPTANLDADGCMELERLLKSYSGAFILVSHDRALLDGVCDGILALEGGKARRYSGGWSDYKRVRDEQRERELFEYEQYRAEEKRLKQAIQGTREKRDQVKKTPSRMGNSEARLHKRASTAIQKQLDQHRRQLESRVDHLDKKPRPTAETKLKMSENLPKGCQGIVSDTALRINHLTLYGGDKLLLSDVNVEIGSRVITALIGPNGCGKSTLLRAAATGSHPDEIRLANGLRVGYFSQDAMETLSPSATLLDNVMHESAYPQDVARTALARLGLNAADMMKPAGALSGGERAKCLLARLLLATHNFLLLDEPGNYLDIYAMEALDSLLGTYPHGILLVSHDRRLVDQVASRRLVISGHGIKDV
ncbi:MAG: ATP-binding cassette domain-containing protein [Oscillospiraceae bacterium]|jgi:macrolide transport system ATP-binding/permease protein|nr:ATP-binding cassette domain-containing protein [Oscillospiraceae bacterium]